MPQARHAPVATPSATIASRDPDAAAARRRRLREAVLGRGAPPDPAPQRRAITGTILDSSPHLLVLRTAGAEVRVPMTQSTVVWHAGRADPSELRPDRWVVARPSTDGLSAERIWVDITRVVGTIVSRTRDSVQVDTGPHREPATVVIPPQALRQVLVRHPRFEPGCLVDIIGTRCADTVRAVRPGAAQPGYRADEVIPPPMSDRVPAVLRGTATWHEDERGAADGRGAAYPAVDPDGTDGGCPNGPSEGCVRLPYLSQGSELSIHNECTGRTCTVPVTECGCVAARYCDRCVECGTSPRGRLVELTPASFVDLGGDLAVGCFNASVVVR